MDEQAKWYVVHTFSGYENKVATNLEKIVENRSSREYLDAVAEAMEENGENGAAYQALVELRDTLDDICEFYEGVVDYTDAVGQAAEGALKRQE